MVVVACVCSSLWLCNSTVSFLFLQNSCDEIEKWVLCRIYLKKRNSEIDENCEDKRVENAAVTYDQRRFFYFTRRDEIVFDSVSSSSSSSSSSGITEVSSNGEDLDEESSSSSCNFFWHSAIANSEESYIYIYQAFFILIELVSRVWRKCKLYYWKQNISTNNGGWILVLVFAKWRLLSISGIVQNTTILNVNFNTDNIYFNN